MKTNIVIDISPGEILVFELWAKMLANQNVIWQERSE